MTTAQRIIRDQTQAADSRSNFDNQWYEISQRLWPAAVELFWQAGQKRTIGQKNTELMYDGTTSIALDRYSAVLASLMVPVDQKWHRLKTTDPALNKRTEVKEWYDAATTTLFGLRASKNSGFYPQMNVAFRSIGAFGNGVIFIDKAIPSPTTSGRGIRYRHQHLAETYLKENYQGNVDTAYRKFSMTHRQAQQMVDDKVFSKLPEKVAELLKDGKQAEDTYTYIHCVTPNDEFDAKRADFRGMAFREYYVCVQTNEIVGESGYRTFPFAVGRPAVSPGETYGRGPGQTVLPNIKILNEQKKTIIKVGHQIADPTWLAHDDGIVDTFSVRPGFMNAGGVDAQGRKLVQPLHDNRGQVPMLENLMEQERNVINDAFLVTLFQILVDTPRMTATEVLDNARQRSILLSPSMAPLQSGFIGGIIERELDILLHAGMISPMPEALKEALSEGDIELRTEVEYDNPLTRQMRAEEAAGLARWTEQLLQAAQITQDPGLLDYVDWDTAAPELADINAVPARWVATEDQIAEKREKRNTQQAIDTAIQAGPAVAGLLKEDAGGPR